MRMFEISHLNNRGLVFPVLKEKPLQEAFHLQDFFKKRTEWRKILGIVKED